MLYPSLSFRNGSRLFAGSTVAYSLRSFSDSSASVVKIRRSSDNAEQDFSADELTDGTLATWVGANNGFVTTWYDQSGNGNHATQATASKQPKIYDSSTGLVLENSEPALNFDGANDTLINSTLFSSGAVSLFVVAESQSSGSLVVVPRTTPNLNMMHELLYTANFDGYQNISFPTSAGTNSGGFPLSTANGNQVLLSYIYDGVGTDLTDYMINENGVTKTIVSSGSFSYPNAEIFSIGSRSIQNFLYFAGNIQEIILFNSDQSSNRTAIESNINGYYGIY